MLAVQFITYGIGEGGETVQPMGHVRPEKSVGLTLPRHYG